MGAMESVNAQQLDYVLTRHATPCRPSGVF